MATPAGESPPKPQSGESNKSQKYLPPTSLPRPLFSCLGRQGVSFYSGPQKQPDATIKGVESVAGFTEASIPAKRMVYCRDGSRCALLQEDGVAIYEFKDSTDESGVVHTTANLVTTLPRRSIQQIALSPLGTYLVTIERLAPNAPKGNLIAWSIDDLVKQMKEQSIEGEQAQVEEKLEPAIAFREYNRNLDVWPAFKFSADEAIATHMVTNEVRIYNGDDLRAGFVHRIRVPGMSSYEFKRASENLHRFAIFKPEAKGKPAQVCVYSYPGPETPTAVKSMFKAQSATLYWNIHATVVLAHTETQVDSTGQSYYGESGMHLLHANGQYDCIVVPTKEGMVQDVAWSPKGNGFIMIAGKMPSNSTLYNIRGEPVFEFGQAHRNTIRWSPSGRFLCLGGFGNLAGDMDFWDVNKKAKMNSLNANSAVSYQWSPDGRYFLTATLSPRMRVDNGYTIYNYRGEVIHKCDWKGELYYVQWRNALPNVYPDRPQSPIKTGSGAPAAKAAPPPSPAKRVYRPPGATSMVADMMRRERGGTSTGKYVAPRPQGVPGQKIVQPSLGPSKAKLRRDRKKKAAEAAAAAAAAEPAGGEARDSKDAGAAVDTAKVLRKLKKQLKQIDELESRLAEGVTLNDEQVAKVAKKESLLAEVASLE